MIVKQGSKEYQGLSLEELKKQYPDIEEIDSSWNDFIKKSYWIENDYDRFIVIPTEANSHHFQKIFGVKNDDMEELW